MTMRIWLENNTNMFHFKVIKINTAQQMESNYLNNLMNAVMAYRRSAALDLAIAPDSAGPLDRSLFVSVYSKPYVAFRKEQLQLNDKK